MSPRITAVLVVAALTVAITIPAVYAQPKPLKIGVCLGAYNESLPLDDDTARQSISMINGITWAAMDRGYKIELVTSTIGCFAETIDAGLEKLVKEDGVKAIVGSFCSGVLIGAAPTIAKLKVPVITATSGALNVSYAGEYVWRTVNGPRGAEDLIMKALAPVYKKIAFLYDNSLIGKDHYALGLDAYTKAGGTSTYAKMFPWQTITTDELAALVDEETFIRKARAADPEFPVIMMNEGILSTSADLELTTKAYLKYKTMFGLDYMDVKYDASYQTTFYTAATAVIRAAQAAGHKATPTQLNRALGAKGFTFEAYTGTKSKFDMYGDIVSSDYIVVAFNATKNDYDAWVAP
ncbi:hypothetical protein HYH03_007237 [Edaphochlamys debaryana]|uniref:Leucine-binding protein domain-containing protein n=1 Tax=Edaphochlamys debaryana TaxID=47281 RepID=A0A835Y4S6_9CHLO|nr:hypothetical protein HYH03_007237 [Edaphochlamys debaryana]|eukprot:KAG2494723.1 hypothetical protein HYH03_007237 [Edaphochlamys debaryana]